MLVGKSERIIFNFGIAGSQVKTLNDKYSLDKVIPVAIGDLPEDVPMRPVSPFRIGAYFGISFNLSGNKNKETFSQISKM